MAINITGCILGSLCFVAKICRPLWELKHLWLGHWCFHVAWGKSSARFWSVHVHIHALKIKCCWELCMTLVRRRCLKAFPLFLYICWNVSNSPCCVLLICSVGESAHNHCRQNNESLVKWGQSGWKKLLIKKKKEIAYNYSK